MVTNQYVIGVIVSNVSGVLSRVSGMFTRRGFNIDCLTVGETESAGFSRITVAFRGDDDIRDKILKQLEKLHAESNRRVYPAESSFDSASL